MSRFGRFGSAGGGGGGGVVASTYQWSAATHESWDSFAWGAPIKGEQLLDLTTPTHPKFLDEETFYYLRFQITFGTVGGTVWTPDATKAATLRIEQLNYGGLLDVIKTPLWEIPGDLDGGLEMKADAVLSGGIDIDPEGSKEWTVFLAHTYDVDIPYQAIVAQIARVG